MKEDPAKTPYINDFVSRCFRDVADEDYLAARAAFKSDLIVPTLTNGHQALEKYLKAILLYNRHHAKYGHDLEKLFAAVHKIPDIAFDFPPRVAETVKYFEAHGRSRYFEVSYHKRDDICLRLDHAVWSIRRYCFFLRSSHNGRSLLAQNVGRIQAEATLEAPHRYRIVGGYLEKLLNEQVPRRTKARDLLVWKNFFYGGRRRKTIRNYKMTWSAANSPLSMHPEIFDDLERLVSFSREFKEAFKQWVSAGVDGA